MTEHRSRTLTKPGIGPLTCRCGGPVSLRRSVTLFWLTTQPPSTTSTARHSQILASLPVFQNGAKSGFQMCFGPSALVAVAKHVSNPEQRSLCHSVFAGVSGNWPFGKLLWPWMRRIATPQNGPRHGQHYSTPSIYPGASGQSTTP